MPDACSVCEQKSELDYLSAASTSWATHPELLNLLVLVGGAGFEPALSHVLGYESDGIVSLILMLRVLNPWFSQHDDCDLLATRA